MSPDSLPRVLVCALTAVACFYAPGRAIVGPSTSTLPAFFARVLASAIVSTLIATGLAATDHFSLSTLLAGNALATVAAFVVRRLATTLATIPGPHSTSPRDLVGPLVVISALVIYWPASPSFLGAADSTTYVATGISLAHHGSLAREDELGPTLPKPLRSILFDSMSQVLFSSGPPYRRMPGAMLIESLDATRAWSCFFPVPTVWAGVFVVARAPGGATDEEGAPGFAPVFAALALWSFWILARAWLGAGYGIVAVVLLGACAPFYGVARSPLSEPIATFFALGGLAVLANAGSSLRRSDAILAGAALGAAVFTRVEVGLFLAMAFAISTSLKARSATGSGGGSRAQSTLRPAFFVSLALVSSLVLVQAALVPGSYVSPLLDQLTNARVVFHMKFGYPSPPILAMVALFAVATVYAGARVVGLSVIVRWGFVAGVLVGHAAASTFLWQRTPMWLSFYLGWPGLALAAIGAVMAWKDRAKLANAPLLLGLAAAVALILFYNPHVYPALPWGARRFVPLLLPSLILLGCYSAARVASRSRLASLAVVGVLAFEVAAGGRPIWGKNLMEEAWDQLAQINAIVPQGGTILFDREISPMMVGPALWLIHDRNGITVPPTGSRPAREYLPQVVAHYAATGPVYYVTRGVGNQIRTPRIKMELLGRAEANLRFVEQTYDRRPARTERYSMPIAVYRLDVSLDPLGDPVPSFMISVPLPQMKTDEGAGSNAEE